MEPARWQLIRTLFDELIEIDPSAWKSTICSRCPDDAELRAEVLDMLAADLSSRDIPSRLADRSPGLLGECADAEDAREAEEWVGRPLGAWRVVRPLGRGGMGVVYLAEREEGGFRQQAAIKLLRTNDHGAGLQRFLAERQILAELEHKNIARLLDGGQGKNGVPWFALEYVEGVAVTAWCDGGRLGIRERLRLFLDVCGAVAYAHEHLIIHRDLKPANMLVDTTGQVKLLDFGIAKLIDDDLSSTQTAVRVFTPEYAAPEQVRGERMTTAVDVYSLGVLLYELLTGRRPYRPVGDTGRALERAILEQAPSRPSQIAGQLPKRKAADEAGVPKEDVASNRSTTIQALRTSLSGDLDAIVLKALRKEPERRYATVREFAQDVQAFLDRRPVAARSGGLRYTVDRFVRRNVFAVGFAGLAFLGLTIGLMIALVQADQARKQRDLAQAEAAKARQALEFMTGLFEMADPGAVARGDMTARHLLEEGVRNIRFAFADQPIVRLDMLLAMASAYQSLALPAFANPLIEEAMKIAETGNSPVALGKVALARCGALGGLGGEGRSDECERISRLAEEGLDVGDPAQAELVASLIGVRIASLFNDARFEDAEREIRYALGLLGSDARHARQRQRLTMQRIYSLNGQGRQSESELIARALLAEMRASPSSSPRDTAQVLARLAETLVGNERTVERLALLRESLAIYEEIYGPDHPAQADRMNNLATALYRAGESQEAIAMIKRVVDVRRKHWGATHPKTGQALINSAVMTLGAEDDAGALSQVEEAIRILEQSELSPIRSLAYLWRASILFLQKRFEEAEEALRNATSIAEKFMPPEHTELLRIRSLGVGLRLAQVKSHAERVAACSEATQLAAKYADSKERDSKEAAFVRAVSTMCNSEDTEVRSRALDQLSEFLSSGDPKGRQARLVMENLEVFTDR